MSGLIVYSFSHFAAWVKFCNNSHKLHLDPTHCYSYKNAQGVSCTVSVSQSVYRDLTAGLYCGLIQSASFGLLI